MDRDLNLPGWNEGWEDGVPRVAQGVAHRVQRLKCLGNAAVPRIPALIGLAILQNNNLQKLLPSLQRSFPGVFSGAVTTEDHMPKAPAVEPWITAHVAKAVAKAEKTLLATHVAVIKDITATHTNSHRDSGDKARARAHATHGADIVRALKAIATEA